MTRTTLYSLCLLLGTLSACEITKPKVIKSEGKRIEVKADTSITPQDTAVNVILPNVPNLPISRKVDTLLYQALDLSGTVVGQRNPLGQRQGSMEITIPIRLNLEAPDTKDSLIAIAYWIGIGEAPISEYEALKEKVPPEWSRPDVSTPLAAYGLGYPVVLPGLTASEERFQQEQVRFDFVNLQDRAAFANQESYIPVLPRDPEHPNLGIVSGEQLQNLNSIISLDSETGKKAFRFNFAYANQHEINSYTLQLKVVALYEVIKQ